MKKEQESLYFLHGEKALEMINMIVKRQFKDIIATFKSQSVKGNLDKFFLDIIESIKEPEVINRCDNDLKLAIS